MESRSSCLSVTMACPTLPRRRRLALRAQYDIGWHTRPRHLLGLRRAARRRAGLRQFRTAAIVTREYGNDRVALLCVAGAARRRGRARGCEDVGPCPLPNSVPA